MSIKLKGVHQSDRTQHVQPETSLNPRQFEIGDALTQTLNDVHGFNVPEYDFRAMLLSPASVRLRTGSRCTMLGGIYLKEQTVKLLIHTF